MRILNSLFLFLILKSFLFSSSLVYDPYGDLNTSTDDTDFQQYLDYVTSDLLSKQENKTQLEPKNSYTDFNSFQSDPQDYYSFTEISSSSSSISPLNGFFRRRDIDSIVSPIEATNEGGYAPFVGVGSSVGGVSSTPYFDKDGLVTFIDRNYSPFFTLFDYNLAGTAQSAYYSALANYKTAIHAEDILGYMHNFDAPMSSNRNDLLDGINSQITTSNILSSSANGKLDSIATLLSSGSSNLLGNVLQADTNAKLDDIKNLLGSTPDGSISSVVDSAIAGMGDFDTSFLDNLQTDFNQLKDDVTSVKQQYDDLKATIESGFTVPDIGTSNGSCYSVGFNLLNTTYYPLGKLSDVLSNYSAVFAFLTYVFVMFFNFRFVFRFFSNK